MSPFSHSIKEFSECITFYNGAAEEGHAADASFETLYWKFRSLFKRTFFQQSWTTFQTAGEMVVAIVAILFVISKNGGTLDGKELTIIGVQSATAAVSSLLQALTSIPSLYAVTGTLAGLTHRVSLWLVAVPMVALSPSAVTLSHNHHRHQRSLARRNHPP